MEFSSYRRPISKSNSTSKLYFNSPQQKAKSAIVFPEQSYFHSIKFENLHELNRKRTGFLISNNDAKRQVLRKKSNNFSNQMDNYYYPKYHKSSWWPNGEYIIKRRYNYTGIGLEHFYEKNNVEQLKTLEDKDEKEKKDADYLKDFTEYNNLKPNEYIITIEHCASCEEHKNITQHQTDTIFKELAIKYQKIIQERFPFIKVFLKPIDVEIVKNEKFKFPKVLTNGGSYPSYPKLNNQFKQCRIGAFEIQIATMNDKNETIKRIIHSKLKTKKFPDVNTVLKKIVSFMPKFNLKLVLFDKEDYDEIEKMDNIQVNLYLCNSNVIKEVGDSTQEQVLNFTSPGRRLLMLREQKLRQQQSFIKNDVLFKNKKDFNLSPISSPRITSAVNHKVRGISANKSSSYLLRPISSNTNYKINNKLIESSKSRIKSGKNFGVTSINGSEKFTNSYESFFKIGKEINSQATLKSQKGVLIKRKFSKIDKNTQNIENSKVNDEDEESSESVTLYFDELPYDTYIIETIENSNFQGSLTLLKFNELKIGKDGLVTKHIGLWHQENAILNIHLYTEKERKIPLVKNGNENDDINNEEEKKIIVRPPSSNQRRINNEEQYEIRYEQEPIISGSINISDADDPNSRYKVYPNSKGIYEYKTIPGEYKLEVYNEDYEKIVMKILLKCGLNSINIKLKQEKCCDLKVKVLEYNEYPSSSSINNFYSNYINHISGNQNNEEIEENAKNDLMKSISEELIYIQPVRNAEIQIFKNGDELLVEGITNRKGIMKYLVEKNENDLTIKVSKTGYFRAERFFKRNSNMQENEKGNYDCIMTFILVKMERLLELNKVLFISYSNMCKKIFELDVQNADDDKNKCLQKDMQEENGIFLASFWYENHPREKDNDVLDENSNDKKDITNKNDNNENINENNDEDDENIDDYSDITNYEEIVRFGLKILPQSIKNEDNKNIYELTRINDRDLIEYLRNICCEGNIYTPNYDFHINLPKVLCKNRITSKFALKENENNNNDNSNSKSNYTNMTMKNSKNTSSQQKSDFEGIYWDLGWIDVKNTLFYETSVYFRIDYKPERLIFFENFIEFLQIFIDKRICDSLFTFFNFDLSVLAASDRYLPKKIFESKIHNILDEETKNTVTGSQNQTKEATQKQKEMQRFIQFICNILCGYDEDNNIRDDSISFSLLRKKISSNLQNFANYSSEGKKDNKINNTNENEEEEEFI